MGLLDNMCFADVQEPCPSLDLMLPVSQECPFLIVSLVYFTYFQFTRRCRKMYISKLSIQKMVRNTIHMSYIGCSFPQPKKKTPKTNERTTWCDKVCHCLATGRWFSPGPSVSATNKTDRHDIIEILLKVALNTTEQTNKQT
jgi:hypothetical protein